MYYKRFIEPTLVIILGLTIVAGSLAIAEPGTDSKNSAPAQIKLPPGWTEADMQACMLAATPGKIHEQLAKGAGTWQGKQTMWMYDGADPVKNDITSKVTPIMDGRYLKIEFTGQTPGMGPFSGLGITGYDNVSQRVVSTWIDNWSTGIMYGVGEVSDDGKTITTKMSYNCPLTKKPAVMREIETTTGPNTKTLEMFSTDPKSGKEFKMLSIELTRK
jgi:hypothetical protein